MLLACRGLQITLPKLRYGPDNSERVPMNGSFQIDQGRSVAKAPAILAPYCQAPKHGPRLCAYHHVLLVQQDPKNIPDLPVALNAAVRSPEVKGRGWGDAGTLPQLQQLRHMEFGGEYALDSSARHLARSRQLPYLCVSHSQVPDRVAVAFGCALPTSPGN